MMNIPTTELTFSEFVECCLRAGYARYFNQPIPPNHPKKELLTHQGSTGIYSLHDSMLQGVRDVSESLRNPKAKRPTSPKGRGERDHRDRK
jgi:hypothetical protein